MQRLRSLTLFLVSLIGGSPLLGQSIAIELSSDSRSGALDVMDLSKQIQTSSLTEEIVYRTDPLFLQTVAQVGVQIRQPDYSDILVRSAEGIESPLSDLIQRRSQFDLSLGVERNHGQDFFFLSGGTPLSDAPFPTQTVGGKYVRGFFEKTTQVGVELTYLNQKQPESFFIDRDFKTKERPQSVNAYEAALSYEQVLTENWKILARVAVSQRIEERPANISTNIDPAYAVTDSFFLRAGLRFAQEQEQGLKNERGYFKAYGAWIGGGVEPVYDLVISASYGVLIESENEPRTRSFTELASDHYSLGLAYSFSLFEFKLNGSYSIANTQASSLAFSSGVTWNI